MGPLAEVGATEQSMGWAGSNEAGISVREKEGHFCAVSHCRERLGSLPVGLTALSRNVCD